MKMGAWSPEEIETSLRLYADGRSYGEIGAELDRNPHNVRRALRRAREARGIPLDTQRPSGKSQRWLDRYLEATEGWPKLKGSDEHRDRLFVRAVVMEAQRVGLI
jgi:hypothetical protein